MSPSIAVSVRSPRAAGSPALALAASAAGVVAAALWFAWVSVTVLPSRDPAHVGFWRGVAAALFALAVFGFAGLRPGRRARAERLVRAGTGTAALGLGLGVIAREAGATAPGAHFEGYLVLLGAIVAIHGAVSLFVSVSGGAASRE
jgi:hypothetical protein